MYVRSRYNYLLLFLLVDRLVIKKKKKKRNKITPENPRCSVMTAHEIRLMIRSRKRAVPGREPPSHDIMATMHQI